MSSEAEQLAAVVTRNERLAWDEIPWASAEERRAVEAFADVVRAEGITPVPPPYTLARFLIGCKRRVPKALAKLRRHRAFVQEYGLDQVTVDDLRPALRGCGRFLCLGGWHPASKLPGQGEGEEEEKEDNVVRVCVFRGELYDPTLVPKAAFLKLVLLKMDYLTSDLRAARNGIVLCYNLRGLGWHNTKLDVLRGIVRLTTQVYPVRLRGVRMVNPTTFFRVLYALVSPLVPRKIRTRVLPVSEDELTEEMGRDILPAHVGGTARPRDFGLLLADFVGLHDVQVEEASTTK